MCKRQHCSAINHIYLCSCVCVKNASHQHITKTAHAFYFVNYRLCIMQWNRFVAFFFLLNHFTGFMSSSFRYLFFLLADAHSDDTYVRHKRAGPNEVHTQAKHCAFTHMCSTCSNEHRERSREWRTVSAIAYVIYVFYVLEKWSRLLNGINFDNTH